MGGTERIRLQREVCNRRQSPFLWGETNELPNSERLVRIFSGSGFPAQCRFDQSARFLRGHENLAFVLHSKRFEINGRVKVVHEVETDFSDSFEIIEHSLTHGVDGMLQ